MVPKQLNLRGKIVAAKYAAKIEQKIFYNKKPAVVAEGSKTAMFPNSSIKLVLLRPRFESHLGYINELICYA